MAMARIEREPVVRAGDWVATEIYQRLETEVLPGWREPARWADIMRSTVAINASFFNTHRMLGQYVMRACQGEE
jgi:hypothetical protein